MNYKAYRKLLYVFLLSLLGLIRGAYALQSDAADKSSAANFFDASVIEVENLDELSGETSHISETGAKMVIPSGEPIGIYVKSEGVMVIAPGEIEDKNGNTVSPCDGLLKAGDYILSVNSVEISDKNILIETIRDCGGNRVTLEINRDDEIISCDITPAETKEGYMLGVWVKDDISGIGTLTYIDETGFAALGHSINDNDTGEVFKVSDGAIYKASLVNIVKPKDGKPGKLEGVIDYSLENVIGRVDSNSDCGVSGNLTQNGSEALSTGEWIPVAEENEIRLGEAYILSGVSGERKYYKIEIVDIDISGDGNKNLELKVVDEELLNETGGIVQGLSGTPIIQDGRLIGAVTHVFVNDATKGYGIFIGNMMDD